MAPEKIVLRLNPCESRALYAAALQDLRRPTDQARMLLRQALGLTDITTATTNANRGAMDFDPQRAAIADN